MLVWMGRLSTLQSQEAIQRILGYVLAFFVENNIKSPPKWLT